MVNISGPVKYAIVILVLSLTAISLLRARDYTKKTQELDKAVLDVIGERGVGEKDLVYEGRERFKSGRHSFSKITRYYEVSSDFDTDEFITAVNRRLERLKFYIAKTLREKEGVIEKFSIFFSFKDKTLYELKLLEREYYAERPLKIKGKGARIAIVLDDFGYSMNNLGMLFAIKQPLTVSILPNLPYSRRIAEECANRDLEVILHLPLEPHGTAVNLEQGTIMVGMPEEEIDSLFAKAIDTVPGVKGISNHMGSKATESRALMRNLFEEFKKRELYFLDNLVTDNSVCREVASEIGLRSATRSVFLDNETNEGYIEDQLRHTADLAAKTGWAIAIGHDRPGTIKVLTKTVPQLEKAGFEFVFASELVE